MDEEFAPDYEGLISTRLKQLRKQAGYSYVKLEELTGISRSTLQRYENRTEAKIPLSKLKMICKAYEVSPAYVMGWESKELPTSFYSSLAPLLKEFDCSIEYDNSLDLFIMTYGEGDYPLTVDQVKNIKETTLSFLKFKVQEILNGPFGPFTKQ